MRRFQIKMQHKIEILHGIDGWLPICKCGWSHWTPLATKAEAEYEGDGHMSTVSNGGI